MPLRSMWILVSCVAVCYACYWKADRNPYAGYLAEAFEEIDEHYLEHVNDKQLFDAGVRAMVERLDSYSGFISRDERARFHQSLDQRFGGVGLEVRQDAETKQLVVATPMLDTPAFRAGLRAGDVIVAIDGRALESIAPKDRLKTAVELLQGVEGKPVELTYQRPGAAEPTRVTMHRAIVHVDSVRGDSRGVDNAWDFSLAHHREIGYLRIATFGEHTVEEVAAALRSLRDKNCRGLILDLRDNRGGLLRAAPEICEMFLPRGAPIVTTRDRGGKIRESFVAEGDAPWLDAPLVVLVNGESASASEIVAAALQDNHRATVVGDRTWGKGTVQHVIPVEGGQSRLRLTTSSYWRPSGKNIHRFATSKVDDSWGVRPDAGCEITTTADDEAREFERRRAREIVWPPGARPAEAITEPEDATHFDPAVKKAVAVLEGE